MKLGARVVALAVALAALCAGGASWLGLREVSAALEADARKHAAEVTRAFADSLYVPVVLEDRAGIEERLRGFGLAEGVVSARVRDAAGTDLVVLAPRPGTGAFTVSAPVEARAGTGAPLELGDEEPEAGAPATAPAAPIGSVEATYSLAAARASIARIQRAVFVATLVLFGLAALAGAAFATTIVRPVRRLEAATGRVARGDLSSTVEVSGSDEVAGLARSFNEMVRALSRSREEVRAAAVELARREHLASLGQFTSMIAHEIRNPLGIILSSAQVAQNDSRTPEQRREALGFIGDEVRRLDRILTDFLRFARPRNPVRDVVDLSAVASDAVARYDAPAGVRVEVVDSGELSGSGDASAGGTEVNAAAAASPRRRPAADADLLHQALLNLVKNAVEAGAQHVRVSTAADRETAWLEVEDDGPGFPPEALARAGEPFFTTKVAGSGLGIAVVRQIAQAHGGRLELGARPGARGARVRLHLPLSGGDAPKEPHG